MAERRARQRLMVSPFETRNTNFALTGISFTTHIVCATFEKGGVRELEASIISSLES